MQNLKKGPDKESVVGRPMELGHMVEYQEGAVVSRTIINKPAGTVTVFAFDKGEKLSEHTAPFDAMVHVLEGIAQIVISGKPFTVGAGQMIIMPANEPHALAAIERFKMLLIMIR